MSVRKIGVLFVGFFGVIYIKRLRWVFLGVGGGVDMRGVGRRMIGKFKFK